MSMNNTENTTTRGPHKRPPAAIIVEHEFVGDKTLAEAFIPVLVEDLRRKADEIRTFDSKSDTA